MQQEELPMSRDSPDIPKDRSLEAAQKRLASICDDLAKCAITSHTPAEQDKIRHLEEEMVDLIQLKSLTRKVRTIEQTYEDSLDTWQTITHLPSSAKLTEEGIALLASSKEATLSAMDELWEVLTELRKVTQKIIK